MSKPSNSEVSLEEQLETIEYDLQEVEAKLLSLNERKQYLQNRRNEIKDLILLRKSSSLANKNWTHNDFPWSSKVNDVLKNVFKLDSFRPYQLPAINAVLSKEDVILIMPTGGGKSLCYQLPALVNNGITLVISPLISLMEDQLMGLKALNINAAMLSAQATKEEVNHIQEAMTSEKSNLRLLYVTPEKLAKSKRFMTKLQKTHQIGRLSLIAIDEVHCCSVWGHDFRPDYKFLGILKNMFPDVPMLGLTATATTKVTVDVQKMLSIQGCLVFKATFNRPNLYYEVRPKPSVQKECIDQLEHLLKRDYENLSGIIYTTSIKDCEDLMSELRSRNLRVGCYHANLEPSLRNKVHVKWMSGEYQAVVATIAFGLGIDKPDVRFVIHHALSKSMENFYQESGRAGRDGKPADCILFYRFMDVFKLSTMVFTQQTGLENLYGIVAYCLDSHSCRRSIIASHFDEGWESSDCDNMCDHCRSPRESKKVDITSYCRNLYKIMAHAAGLDTKLTAQKLIDSWFGKGQSNLRVSDVPVPSFSRENGEAIVATLLIEGYLQEDFHFTPYSTISYIKRGRRAAAALSDGNHITMTVKGKSVTSSVVKSNIKNSTDKKNVENSSNHSLTSDTNTMSSSENRNKLSKESLTSHKNNSSVHKSTACSKSSSKKLPENHSRKKVDISHKRSSEVIDLSDSDDNIVQRKTTKQKRKTVCVIDDSSESE